MSLGYEPASEPLLISTNPHPQSARQVRAHHALLGEFMGTFLLCYVVLETAVNPQVLPLSISHGARPVHLIITMIKWFRTSRLSIQNSLSLPLSFLLCYVVLETAVNPQVLAAL